MSHLSTHYEPKLSKMVSVETSEQNPIQSKYQKSFARRLSRGLSERDKRLFATVMPQFAITTDNINQLNFSDYQAINFEIGFGSGEHITQLAQRHPQQLFIGCEPYLNGVSNLLYDIELHQLTNIRINTGDGRLLLEKMPAQSLDTIYILFADPWPKRRHQKRRVINSILLNMIATKLKPSGKLIIATDHVEYADWIELQLSDSKLRSVLPRNTLFITAPPSEWVTTRYEQKALEDGKAVRYYILELE